MSFRDRLLATLRGARALFEVEGVLVAGSEVPNLLEAGAAATLVVSHDVDVAVPVAAHAAVKERLDRLEGLVPSAEEPSVWMPTSDERIELNFIAYDPTSDDPTSVRVLPDDVLPMMVFGPLSFLREGRRIDIGGGVRVPVPRNAGLLLEKLVTERSATKGDRDLLVALGLLLVAEDRDVDEMVDVYRGLTAELQHAVRANPRDALSSPEDRRDARSDGAPTARRAPAPAPRGRRPMTRPGAGTRTGLEERAEAIRARMALRAWEYRQRNGAKGTWTRLRRLLAGAAEVFAIDDEARAELLSEGFRREGVGDELEPPRTYLVVPRTRAMRIAARRPLEIRLSAELLAAPTLVLVPFERP